MELLLALDLAGLVTLFFWLSFVWAASMTALIVGLVIGGIFFFPLLMVSKKIIARFLPMSSGETHAKMAEKRWSYLLCLETAVVNGKIDDEEDRSALEKVRNILGISQREHDLLMDSFASRAISHSDEVVIKELFLIFPDGRLISHAGRAEGTQSDMDVVASMLVAIRGFVQEGLQSQSTELDSIRYGDYSLAIETEENLVLAAVLTGNVTPELRQRLRDHLVSIKEKYATVLADWDGDISKIKGIDALLTKMLSNQKGALQEKRTP